jgi:hypothetical protein
MPRRPRSIPIAAFQVRLGSALGAITTGDGLPALHGLEVRDRAPACCGRLGEQDELSKDSAAPSTPIRRQISGDFASVVSLGFFERYVSECWSCVAAGVTEISLRAGFA